MTFNKLQLGVKWILHFHLPLLGARYIFSSLLEKLGIWPTYYVYGGIFLPGISLSFFLTCRRFVDFSRCRQLGGAINVIECLCCSGQKKKE